MEPKRYCQQAMQELRASLEPEQRTEGHQRMVVLAYFADVQPGERDFTSQLRLLAESAERSGRTALAASARAVLEDYESRLESGVVLAR